MTHFDLQRISHAFSHLRRGTIFWRLSREWHKYQELRRLTWWHSNRAQFTYREVHIQPGLRMRLFADSHLGQEIFTGHFEPRERLFFNLFLRPGDIFIDVGANIGLFTLIAARCVREAGKVFAFDPHPQAACRLVANLQMNGLSNVVFERCALSDQAAILALNLEADDSFSALLPSQSPIVGQVEQVQAICWDDYAREHNLFGKVTLMKIDVEGWEMHVLNGAHQMLSRLDGPTLQVEFNDEAARIAGSSCLALYQTLQDLGYQIFRFNDVERKLVPETSGQSYVYANLLATKQPDEVNQRLRSGHRPLWMR